MWTLKRSVSWVDSGGRPATRSAANPKPNANERAAGHLRPRRASRRTPAA